MEHLVVYVTRAGICWNGGGSLSRAGCVSLVPTSSWLLPRAALSPNLSSSSPTRTLDLSRFTRRRACVCSVTRDLLSASDWRLLLLPDLLVITSSPCPTSTRCHTSPLRWLNILLARQSSNLGFSYVTITAHGPSPGAAHVHLNCEQSTSASLRHTVLCESVRLSFPPPCTFPSPFLPLYIHLPHVLGI